jgi:NAD(P)-dependent dehydrogenase (short-subunit alcohol dehydrogenase family)
VAEKITADSGRRAAPVACDVTDAEQAEAAVQRAVDSPSAVQGRP